MALAAASALVLPARPKATLTAVRSTLNPLEQMAENAQRRQPQDRPRDPSPIFGEPSKPARGRDAKAEYAAQLREQMAGDAIRRRDAGEGIGAGLAAVGAVVITFYPR